MFHSSWCGGVDGPWTISLGMDADFFGNFAETDCCQPILSTGSISGGRAEDCKIPRHPPFTQNNTDLDIRENRKATPGT